MVIFTHVKFQRFNTGENVMVLNGLNYSNIFYRKLNPITCLLKFGAPKKNNGIIFYKILLSDYLICETYTLEILFKFKSDNK